MVSNQHGTNFVDAAILNGRVQQLKYAFRNQQDLSDVRTREGFSPLVLALKIPDDDLRRKMFNFLLHRGADISIKDSKTGRDVLTWACVFGKADQIMKLFKYAPGEFNLREPDYQGFLPLHHAVRSGNPFCVFHVVKEMRRYTMQVDIPNSEGLTPFLEAKRMGFELIAQILVKEGKACPTQFDTNTFRTKSRWAEVGNTEREEEEFKITLNEIRITGSCRPHTSYQKRRENSSRFRQTLSTSCTSLSDSNFKNNRPKTSPPMHPRTTQGKELYADFHILDLQDVVEGKTDVETIRKIKANETESDDSSDQNGSHGGRTETNIRRSLGRSQTWSKLNNLMSLSDKASVFTDDKFASSVSDEPVAPVVASAGSSSMQASQANMLTSMMTSLSHQMSTAFRKTAVPKPKVIVKPPVLPAPKKKKGSTLAFILKTTPGSNKRMTRRTSQRRGSVTFIPNQLMPSNAKSNPQNQACPGRPCIKSRTSIGQIGSSMNRMSRMSISRKQSNTLPMVPVR